VRHHGERRHGLLVVVVVRPGGGELTDCCWLADGVWPLLADTPDRLLVTGRGMIRNRAPRYRTPAVPGAGRLHLPDWAVMSASNVAAPPAAPPQPAPPPPPAPDVSGANRPLPLDLARAAELAGEGGLGPVNEIPPLRTYLRQIWQRRHFLWSLASFRFSAANSQDRLGPLWNVLRPTLQALVYTTVFTVLFPNNARSIANYPEYVTAGIFVFTFLSGCLMSGANGVVGDLGLVRTIKFPRAVLPLAGTVVNLLSFLPAVAVLLVILLILGQRPDAAWLAVAPAVGLMALFAAGVALFNARMTVIIRDFTQLLPFFLRLMFYLSGIVVAVNTLKVSTDYPVVGAVLTYEPFFVYMELVRNPLLNGQVAAGRVWIAGGTWALLALVGGLLFFWRGERDYGR